MAGLAHQAKAEQVAIVDSVDGLVQAAHQVQVVQAAGLEQVVGQVQVAQVVHQVQVA